MPKGGARYRSGPAKDLGSLRSATSMGRGEWLVLDPTPRTIVPDWPLPAPTDQELALWAVYWAKPQSDIWRDIGADLEVALHVRTLGEASEMGCRVGLRTLVRQQAGDLLLTHKALTDAKVKIGVTRPLESTTPRTRRPSARERRLALVPDAPA